LTQNKNIKYESYFCECASKTAQFVEKLFLKIENNLKLDCLLQTLAGGNIPKKFRYC